MNKSKKLSLINMIVNLALIVLEIIGVYFFTKTNTFDVMDLKYYTILTVFVTFLGAALMIWANIVSLAKGRDCTPRLFYTIRFLSAVMSLITIVVVCAFLAPSQGVEVIFATDGGFIFMHFICPIISLLQFIFLEIEPKGKFKKTFEPFIATLIYGIAILITVFVIKGQDVAKAADFAPYPFFLVTDDLIAAYQSSHPDASAMSAGVNIGILVGVIFISYAMSVILWALNRLSHNIFIGEVYEVESPKSAKKKKETEVTGNVFANFMKSKVVFGDNKSVSGGQTYHISYHDRKLKTWKVKSENAGRALKVFPTQKEAIDFAKACVKKNGGSIRIHSMVGKIRKDW
ncbi:MAG: DUF2188 domain-containing protein [Bacilli bacterium]|nr:DUF2188 domain-containing protein [Bacilli bacterium]